MILALRDVTRRIIERFSRRSRQVSFVIVEFKDPYVGEPVITSDANEAQRIVEQFDVGGGDDYKEKCFAAIDRAVDAAPPKTPIFVFTEDESKDRELLPEIIRKATHKQIKIFVMLVKGEGFEQHVLSEDNPIVRRRRRRRRLAEAMQPQHTLEDRWQSYSLLAIATGGQLLEAGHLDDEQDIHSVSQVVDTLSSSSRVSLERRWNVTGRSLRQTRLGLRVDPTCTHLNVLVSSLLSRSAHRTNFELRRPPDDRSVDADIVSEQMTSFQVAEPAPGIWYLSAAGAGSGRELPDARFQVLATCESSFDVHIELFELKNGSMFPSLEPIGGAPLVNASLIAIVRPSNVSRVNFTHLLLTDSETDELLHSLRLTSTGKRGWDFYAQLVVPRVSFVMQAVGSVRAGGTQFAVSRVGPTIIPVYIYGVYGIQQIYFIF